MLIRTEASDFSTSYNRLGPCAKLAISSFKPDKNYVGVRLQRGVPLLDADWNELNDVIRNEIYSGFGQAFPDGVAPGSADLQISPTDDELPTNDIRMQSGAVLVGGRPLRVPAPVLYSAQPWFDNPTRADQDGVAVIPLLNPSKAGTRIDSVYLDVWEREVRSTEDANLIHPAIGIETCVRLKREFALRVAEGTETPPAPPVGHAFVSLAFLKRPAGQGSITLPQIEDIRPKLFSTRGPRSVSFLPAFLPFGNAGNPWIVSSVASGATTSTKQGSGYIPLVLPDGAHMLSLRIQTFTAHLFIFMHRVQQGSFQLRVDTQLVEGTAQNLDPVIPISKTNRINIVDNRQCCYILTIQNGSSNTTTTIHHIAIDYQY